MAQEIKEGRRPIGEKLDALKAESRRKRDALKTRVIQELQAGTTTLGFPPEELEGLLDELTIMLIHRNPGGTMLDITPVTTVAFTENGAKIETAGHMRQSMMRIEAAFVNNSIYENGVDRVVLANMHFRPTMGGTLLAAAGAEGNTRKAMVNLHETIGDTLKVMTKGVQGIPPIYSPGIQLQFTPGSLALRFTPQQQ